MNENNLPLTSPNSLTLEFHLVYGQPVRTKPIYDVPETVMRARLVEEEASELSEAVEIGSLIDTSDALGDLVYVCYGAAHTHGINLNGAFGIEATESPARVLLKLFMEDGMSPVSRPSLDHADRDKIVLSLNLAAQEYLAYVLDTSAETGDVTVIQGYLQFIVSGAYYASFAFGIPLDAVLQEIQRSNMSKLDEDGNPIYREDGKVLKGPNFFIPEPNIANVLAQAGASFTSEADLQVVNPPAVEEVTAAETEIDETEVVETEAIEEELNTTEAEVVETYEDSEEELVEEASEEDSGRDLFSSEVIEEAPTETFSKEDFSTAQNTDEAEEYSLVHLEDVPTEAIDIPLVEEEVSVEEVKIEEPDLSNLHETIEVGFKHGEDSQIDAENLEVHETETVVEFEEENPDLVETEQLPEITSEMTGTTEPETVVEEVEEVVPAPAPEAEKNVKFDDEEPDFDGLFRKK